MSDPRALVRVVDELLWTLRREGFVVSPAQAIVVVEALRALPLDEPAAIRDAVAAVVVDRARERPRFDRAFDAFFAARPADRDLWTRLAARGFEPVALETLRALLADLASADGGDLPALGALLEGGAELDRALALAGLTRQIDAQSGPQIGFLGHRLVGQLGAARVRGALGALRARLADALGDVGLALADALSAELTGSEERVRAHVRRVFDAKHADAERARADHRLDATPFASLSEDEIADVRRAVARLAERLRGGARVRLRRARRGRIDPARTLRAALATGGVPFLPAHRRRARHRPRIILLCDVSDSVRSAAAFLLELTYALQELVERTRTFVFVSELAETTDLFARQPVRTAIAHAWGGTAARAGDNSNYGRALRTFEARHLGAVDRRTTVVILGDGRTNYLDAAPDVLDRVRERARALLWLCPEPRGAWSSGDSAMAVYAPRCTAVHPVTCARDLEDVARRLISRA